MNRRRYLHALAGTAGALGLAGCASRLPGASDTPTPEPSPSSSSTSTDPPADTPTATTIPGGSDSTLRAGGHAVALSKSRLRASVRRAGVHLDVHDEPDTQFLVLDATASGADLDDLPLSLVADGATVADRVSFLGWPESRRDAPVALPVPVASYDAAALVLEADGETDRWPLPEAVVATFGSAPDFRIESFEVPGSVQRYDSFRASFTVANRGDRDARFLTEFGHALLSDTGEVALEVPAGESRTHEQRIDPYWDSQPETVPVVLDWGLDRRYVEVAVEDGESPRTEPTATASQ